MTSHNDDLQERSCIEINDAHNFIHDIYIAPVITTTMQLHCMLVYPHMVFSSYVPCRTRMCNVHGNHARKSPLCHSPRH